MNDDPYNRLPDEIKQKYNIIYSELLTEDFTLFRNKDLKFGVLKSFKKWGLFTSYQYLIKPIYNSIGFNKNLNLFQASIFENDQWDADKNKEFYLNTDGKIVWELNRGEFSLIDDFGNIFIEKNKKIGLVDQNFNQIIEPKYDRINTLNQNYFKVFVNGRYGIINQKAEIIFDADADEIFNNCTNSTALIYKNNTYYSFNFDHKTLTELPFDKILYASSNSYKAPTQESQNLYKSIKNIQPNDEHDFISDELLNYKGKWGIIDTSGTEIIPNEYDYVDFLRNPNYFLVGIGEIETYEFVDEDLEDRTGIKNIKWGIVDKNNNTVVPIIYDWIDEVEETIWVVYEGGNTFYDDEYWKNTNGKLGAYNLNQLIVPIEYDTIKNNWFRIKEYIFVQNGTKYFDDNSIEYDVYTTNGFKIESDKPNPKEYTYFD